MLESVGRVHGAHLRAEPLRRYSGSLALALVFGVFACSVASATQLPAQIGAGTLLVPAGSGFDEVAPLSTDVGIAVSGIVARVSVTQTFHNASSAWIEAVYALPLPDDAAVNRLTMHIGERVIEGEIRERRQAESIYKQARDAGQHASLVFQQRPNLFTTAVANIPPGDTIEIRIEYLQTVHYGNGEFSLRFPMTLTPRYAPAGEKTRADAGLQSHAFSAKAASINGRRLPNGRSNEASIQVVLTPGMPLANVRSSSHEIRVAQEGNHYTIETAQSRVPMDRDFVLSWRPVLGSEPTVVALTETLKGTTYALLMILPPASAHQYRALPRELIYVVDTSGSMAGESMREAKLALIAPWSRSVSITPGSSTGIAALWARRKIEYLMDSRVEGADEELIRKMVVKVALEHHLVSPFTSLVAVDRTPARASGTTLERDAVPNMIPAGAAYGELPQTATPAPHFRLLGMLLLAATGLWLGLSEAWRRGR